MAMMAMRITIWKRWQCEKEIYKEHEMRTQENIISKQSIQSLLRSSSLLSLNGASILEFLF
jgi:hypothetical protein